MDFAEGILTALRDGTLVLPARPAAAALADVAIVLEPSDVISDSDLALGKTTGVV
uniref:Uncharacterized protein n=1 Tax=Arion vulgaris TaxID=1028688 RepID=A0A0B7A294_9EUPU